MGCTLRDLIQPHFFLHASVFLAFQCCIPILSPLLDRVTVMGNCGVLVVVVVVIVGVFIFVVVCNAYTRSLFVDCQKNISCASNVLRLRLLPRRSFYSSRFFRFLDG